MKKFLSIVFAFIAMFLTSFSLYSQTEYTLEGKSLEVYEQRGDNFNLITTLKADVALYLNTYDHSFLLLANETIVLGIYGDMLTYSKKDKLIDPNDIDKMIKKNKIKYYLFESKVTSNLNYYQFYLPYELDFVKFTETSSDNKNGLFSFKVINMYNGKPELPDVKDNYYNNQR